MNGILLRRLIDRLDFQSRSRRHVALIAGVTVFGAAAVLATGGIAVAHSVWSVTNDSPAAEQTGDVDEGPPQNPGGNRTGGSGGATRPTRGASDSPVPTVSPSAAGSPSAAPHDGGMPSGSSLAPSPSDTPANEPSAQPVDNPPSPSDSACAGGSLEASPSPDSDATSCPTADPTDSEGQQPSG